MARSPDSEPLQIAGGRTSIAVFALIAILMATDLTIEYRRGVQLALQTFELLIFLSALAGIALHWWQMSSARRVSERLDRELAETRAEAREDSPHEGCVARPVNGRGVLGPRLAVSDSRPLTDSAPRERGAES